MWGQAMDGGLMVTVQGRSGNNSNQPVRIAAFDWDFTLVRPRDGVWSGSSDHPANWSWLNGSVARVLNDLHAQEYHVVVFSNQASIGRHGFYSRTSILVRQRFDAFLRLLSFKAVVVVACHRDSVFRKPGRGMWDYAVSHLRTRVDYGGSFFVGDCAGRVGDFSDCDIKFAECIGIRFVTPEDFFIDAEAEAEAEEERT